MSKRKDAAVSFLNLAASGRVREAYDGYVSTNFHHHNPYFADGARIAELWGVGQEVPAESVNATGCSSRTPRARRGRTPRLAPAPSQPIQLEVPALRSFAA